MTEKPNSVCKHCLHPIDLIDNSWQSHATCCPYNDGRHEPAEPSASPLNEHGNTICVPCQQGKHDECYAACACEDRGHKSAEPTAKQISHQTGGGLNCLPDCPACSAPQPVAGEGPRCNECGDEIVWVHKSHNDYRTDHKIEPMLSEGTPKLEEADDCATRFLSEYPPEKFSSSREMLRNFALWLHPFITPACSPPNVDEMIEATVIGKWMEDLDYVQGNLHGNNVPEAKKMLRALWDRMETYAITLVATPASTGEALTIRCRGCKSTLLYKRISDGEIEVYHDCTNKVSTGEPNGWISVEERLPKEMVNVIWGRPDDYEHNWTVDEIRQDSHPEDYYTHWRPKPPAPTSVPQQAEPPK